MQAALLAFKAGIQADPYGVFTSWNDSQHFCNWRGVTCGRRHRRVTALLLSSLKLTGDLSPHIANLTFLRVMDLRNNNFRGPIHREFTRLHRLEELRLPNNSFQGELPRNLSSCSNLNVIDLSGNALGGEIHAELGSLSRLQTLYLPINNFIGTIPPSLGNLSSLQYLSLARNHLEGNIPTELGQLSSLKFLQLSSNNLSGTVPKQLFNISSIYLFAIADNQLQGQIPPYIGLSLPNLKEINLSLNKFSGPIPTSIVNSSGLTALEMAFNSLSGPIPKNLGSLKNLQALNFGVNLLESYNDLSFLTSLTNCTNLNYLRLSLNNLQAFCQVPLVISLQMRIDRNHISGTIPEEIGNLVGLQFLALHREMPHSLGNMTQVIKLLVDDNQLGGEIPASLGNCSRLEVLDVSSNCLKGNIPKEAVGQWSFSRALYFASNRLTGTLPPEIGNCKNLNTLDVSNNTLHGEIPSSLENCVMLESIGLQDNSFEGAIPSSFQKLKSMQVLDLANNNLSGQIPEFLGELPLLTGKVPIKGVFENVSEFSVDDNSELCGGIKPLGLPDCPTEIAKKRKSFPHRAVIATVPKVGSIQHSQHTPLDKKHPKLSYAELLHATDNFSPANLIGKGRYGSVYKGILSGDDQTTIAVKVLDLQQRGADRTFKAECEALRKLRHRNLVKVITSCSSIDYQGNDFKALVFELMPNGSLETWLHPSSTELHSSPSLNLIQRLNIANLTSRISDFGLTRFLSETTKESSSMGVRGTMGYIPPEYGMGMEISTHGDVYSYGIVLMELFTGKRPTDGMFTGDLSLREYVKTAMPDHVAEIVETWLNFEDEAAINQIGQSSRSIGNIWKCLGSVLSIGLSCSADSPSERMNIKDVLRELQKAKNMLLGDQRRRGLHQRRI
ncbi:hypothetical protein GQ457_17G026530 [Hibiscus cannabinus]